MNLTRPWSGRPSPLRGENSSGAVGPLDFSALTAPAAAFAPAHALAVILQGDNGELSARLTAGPRPDLASALTGLSAGARARLQATSGNRLEEFSALSRERDAELFAAGLLALGQNLEDRAAPEVVQRLYHYLASAPAVPPAFANRARERLDVLGGRGAFLPQLEYGFSRVVATSTSAEFLAGMTVGGLAFRAGRLWGLQGLLNAGVRGRTLAALATAAGMSTEAGAFLLTSRGIRGWKGETLSEDWGREYLGTLLMLGGMRLSAGAMSRAYRATQGSGSALRLIPEGFYRQTGMIGGLLGVHSAAMELGLEERRPFAALLAQSGGEWLSFNVGGRLAHGLLGPRIAGLENYLEARGRVLASSAPRGPSFLDAWLPAFAASPRPAFAASGPSTEHMVFSMSSKGARPGHAAADGSYPVREVAGPLRRPPRPSPAPSSGPREIAGSERIWVGSQTELLEWIRGTRGNFHQQVRENHIFFEMVSREHYNGETVLEELNRLPFLQDVFRGRRIQIRFDDGSPSVEFLRLAKRFFPWNNKTSEPEPPRQEESGIVAREMRDVRARMDRLSSPRLLAVPANAEEARRIGTAPTRHDIAIGTAPTLPGISIGSREFGFIRGSQGLMDGLSRILATDRGPAHLEILGFFPRNLDAREISAMRNRLAELKPGRIFTFHDGRALVSYRFARGAEADPLQMTVNRWTIPQDKTNIAVDGMAELMMGLLSLRGYFPPDPGRLTVRVNGRWNPADNGKRVLELLGLDNGVLFREIHLKYVPPHSQSGLPLTQRFIRNERGTWRME